MRTNYGKLAGSVGIFCNLLLALGKFAAGTVFGSIAIVADALNNLSDASSSVISLLGFKLAAKPADNDHPYGHARYEYLAGLAVADFGHRRGAGQEQSGKDPASHAGALQPGGGGGAGGLDSDEAVDGCFQPGGGAAHSVHHPHGHRSGQPQRCDQHRRGAGRNSGFPSEQAEPGWMGLAVALFILYSGVGLVRDTLNPLLGEAPSEELTRHVHDKVMSYPGVLGVHDLMVHDYGPGQRFATLHVEMAAEQDALEAHDLIDNIEHAFWKEDRMHVVIHYDPIVTGDAAVTDLRAWLG